MVGLRGHAQKTTKGPFIYILRKELFFTFSDPVYKHIFVLIAEPIHPVQCLCCIYEWSLVGREGFNNCILVTTLFMNDP